MRREKRVAMSLNEEVYSQLVTLAQIEGKPPAVVARNILTNYLETNRAQIAQAKKAADAYFSSLKILRSHQSSLFSESL